MGKTNGVKGWAWWGAPLVGALCGWGLGQLHYVLPLPVYYGVLVGIWAGSAFVMWATWRRIRAMSKKDEAVMKTLDRLDEWLKKETWWHRRN